jgi:hypothetical protein
MNILNYNKYWVISFSCLTDKPRSNATPDSLPALCRTSHAGEVSQSMAGARQNIAMILTFRNQYNETNVMHFLFNLLRIKGL